MFSHQFHKGNNYRDFLYVFLGQEAFSKGSFLKGKNLFKVSRFFPLGVSWPLLKREAKRNVAELLPLIVYAFPFRMKNKSASIFPDKCAG